MSENNPNPKSTDGESGKEKVGQWLRKTREAKGVDAEKLCSDLRVNRTVLEALESGQYHHLAGDPYIRALLGSISRYLHLDSQAVIARYNGEVGASPAAVQAAPYLDQGPKYRVVHRQVFFAILIALAILVLLITLLNRSGQEPELNPGPAPLDSLLDQGDTALEGTSLAPDSDTLVQDSIPAQSRNAEVGEKVTIRPLRDSVQVRIVRMGKPDYNAYLRIGKQMQIPREDTIFVYTDVASALQVISGSARFVPTQKNFKIFNDTVNPI